MGIVMVGGAYFVRASHLAQSAQNNSASAITVPLREYQYIKDTDRDGMADWEETLRGRNSAMPDIQQPATTTQDIAYEPKTETAKFALQFFTKYLEKKSAGGKNISEQDIQDVIAHESVSFAGINKTVAFVRNDITILKEKDTASIRQYGNSAGRVVLTNNAGADTTETETAILAKAMKEDNPELLKQLDPIIAGYTAMVVGMREVPVPTNMIDEHLALLNTMQAILDDVRGMQLAFDDPVVAIVRVKRYKEDALALLQSIEAVRTVLESEDIVYQKNEPGSFFFSLRP